MWNTIYLSEAIKALKKKEQFDEELLKHSSPVDSLQPLETTKQ